MSTLAVFDLVVVVVDIGGVWAHSSAVVGLSFHLCSITRPQGAINHALGVHKELILRINQLNSVGIVRIF